MESNNEILTTFYKHGFVHHQDFQFFRNLYLENLTKKFGEPQIVNNVPLYKINGEYYTFCEPRFNTSESYISQFLFDKRVSLNFIDTIKNNNTFVMRKAELDIQDGKPTFKLAKNPTIISKHEIYTLLNEENAEIQSNTNTIISQFEYSDFMIGLRDLSGKVLIPGNNNNVMRFTKHPQTGEDCLFMRRYGHDGVYILTSEIVKEFPQTEIKEEITTTNQNAVEEVCEL